MFNISDAIRRAAFSIAVLFVSATQIVPAFAHDLPTDPDLCILTIKGEGGQKIPAGISVEVALPESDVTLAVGNLSDKRGSLATGVWLLTPQGELAALKIVGLAGENVTNGRPDSAQTVYPISAAFDASINQTYVQLGSVKGLFLLESKARVLKQVVDHTARISDLVYVDRLKTTFVVSTKGLMYVDGPELKLASNWPEKKGKRWEHRIDDVPEIRGIILDGTHLRRDDGSIVDLGLPEDVNVDWVTYIPGIQSLFIQAGSVVYAARMADTSAGMSVAKLFTFAPDPALFDSTRKVRTTVRFIPSSNEVLLYASSDSSRKYEGRYYHLSEMGFLPVLAIMPPMQPTERYNTDAPSRSGFDLVSVGGGTPLESPDGIWIYRHGTTVAVQHSSEAEIKQRQDFMPMSNWITDLPERGVAVITSANGSAAIKPDLTITKLDTGPLSGRNRPAELHRMRNGKVVVVAGAEGVFSLNEGLRLMKIRGARYNNVYRVTSTAGRTGDLLLSSWIDYGSGAEISTDRLEMIVDMRDRPNLVCND